MSIRTTRSRSGLFTEGGDHGAHSRKSAVTNSTHANVLKQATSLAGYKAPIFLPGITYSTSPDDYSPIKTLFIVSAARTGISMQSRSANNQR